MRQAGAAYAKWMAHHVDLKERYPRDFKYKPAMDWEQRDPPQPGAAGAAGAAAGQEEPGNEDTDPQTWYGGRRRQGRRRQRQRRRGLLQEEQDEEEEEGEEEEEEGRWWQRGRRRRLATWAEASSMPGRVGGDFLKEGKEGAAAVYDVGQYGAGDEHWEEAGQQSSQHPHQHHQHQHHQQQQRRRLAGSKRPSQQRYIDGTPWLSAALGLDLSRAGQEGGEAAREAREALWLPFPYCARHEER